MEPPSPIKALGANPFPSRFIIRTVPRGDFARRRWEEPITTAKRHCYCTSSIKEHQSMLGKLKSVVKALKEHDSTLFQSNGLILKQGEEFAHDFNVKQIKCVEAKVQKVTRDTETLEESKNSFRSIFKGLHRDRISKGRRKKEKKKTVENRMQEKMKGLKTTSNECIVFVLETR